MNPFQLIDARSAADAAALLRTHGPQAQPIAAGGDLLGLMKEGIHTPAVLVNLATATDMRRIERSADGGWRIGAMATLSQIAAHEGLPPMLAQAVARIASPQLRHRTTLGGNLLQRPRCLYFRHPDVMCFKKGGTGCPASAAPPEAYPGALFPDNCHAGHPSDMAPVLMALEAQAEVVNAEGTRLLGITELFAGAGTHPQREARLGAGDVLAAFHLPASNPRQAFAKTAPRDANEFSWASAAVALTVADGRITGARIALGGVSPAPWLWAGAAAALVNQRVDTVDAAGVAQQLLPDDPLTRRHRARAAACREAVRQALLAAG